MDIIFIKQIFIFVGLILGLILIFQLLGFNMNPPYEEKKLLNVVTIETMDTMNNIENHMTDDHDINLEMNSVSNPEKGFCEHYQGNFVELEKSCNTLSQKNCNSTECCTYLNNTKCVSGSVDGPTYQSEGGNKITVDNYYYMNKCYGHNCPEDDKIQ